MEEAKNPDEVKNGDQILTNQVQVETTSELAASESTIAQPEGAKPELDSDALVKEKPFDTVSSGEDSSNIVPVVVVGQPSQEKEAAAAPSEEIAPESSAEESEAAAGNSDAKETVAEATGLQETSNVTESAAPKESDSTSTNMEETPAIEQAMEVEEPVVSAPPATVSIQEQIAQEQQLETVAVQNIAHSSLSLLAQYSGSSDSEAEETDTSKADDAKKRTHSSSSSASSDESSDVELVKGNDPISGDYRVRDDAVFVSDAETMDTNAASSEDEEDDLARGPIRTAGEILPHELPPIEELTITVPETECKPIGHVESIVSQIVLVQSVVGAELLNLDTVLFLERGKRALGKIFDVIGQVNRPLYCVLFNSNQEVLAKNITVGMEVYCAPRTEYTSFIILSDLMRLKGSDASWMNDNEVPAYLAEHSDDEAERAAKKNRKKGAANHQPHQTAGEQSGELNMNHPQHQQQHLNTRQPHPSAYRQQQQHYQQQYHGPPHPGRQYNPRFPPSGNSWHHNYQNPRYHNPHQYRPRFAPRNQQQQHQQQQQQQIPHMQPPPQGGLYLPNPFAAQGPPRPPPSAGPN